MGTLAKIYIAAAKTFQRSKLMHPNTVANLNDHSASV